MKDLFQVICPKCNHSAHMHNGGHCNARWRKEQQFNRFHVCKCELSKDQVLLTVIEQLEQSGLTQCAPDSLKAGEFSAIWVIDPNNIVPPAISG